MSSSAAFINGRRLRHQHCCCSQRRRDQQQLGFRVLGIVLTISATMIATMVHVAGEPIPASVTDPAAVGLNGAANSSATSNKTIMLTGRSKVSDECKAFTHGTSKYEFTTPFYPNNYPDNIDCVKLITAEPGHRIQIRIVESFQMEESPGCKYDYFEARNGQFGYSTVLARVCGTIPPTPILGTGHYMWLRFHSDAGINYGGFKAIITMVPSNDFTQEVGECEEELIGDEGDFKSDDLMARVPYTQRATTCAWLIETAEEKKISLKFEEYKLEKPNDCNHNFIEVYRTKEDYDGRATEHGVEKGTKKFCGSTADSVKSIQNFLAVRFFAVGFLLDNPKRPQFKANFTIYRELKKDATPPDVCDPQAEFDCGDVTCISSALRCNLKYNCDLRSDEEKCPSEHTAGVTPDILVIGLVGCILIFGMCAGMVLNIYRKLKQDREELNELKLSLQKSRESVPESNRIRQSQGESGAGPSSPESASAESKDTVIERKPAMYPPLPQPPPPTSIPPPFSPYPPNGDLKTKYPFKNTVTTFNTAALITYQPPPSYPTKITVKPKTPAPAAEASVGTDDISFSSSPDEEERIVEVRDVACQTRGLMPPSGREIAFAPRGAGAGATRVPRGRAPLAREDAVYELLPVQRRTVRRHSADAIMPNFPSFSSASSETGRSLERLDELTE